MGSIVYDFLSESLLFKEEYLKTGFRALTETEIKKELREYREFILKNVSVLDDEVNSKKSELKVLSGQKRISFSELKNSAFYIEQYLLQDSLFAFTHEEGDTSKAFKKFNNFEKSFDKNGLANELQYLKNLSPLVACDYVKILPISFLHEPEKEIPILASKNLFSDVLPQNVLEFFHNSVEVRSMQMDGNLLKVENKLYPCRSIFLNFSKEDMLYSCFYNLYQGELTNINKKSREFHLAMDIPTAPPSAKEFENWVLQSINQAAKNIFEEIFVENVLAAKYNASYIASNTFAFNLLQQSMNIKTGVKQNTMNILFNYDLPFIDNVNMETILAIRNNDGEVFNNFRINLDKHLKELRSVEDVNVLREKLENILHEITEVQVNEINQKVTCLLKKIKIDSAILFAGLFGAIQTGGFSLLASAIALAKGYKDWNDYYQKVKTHPVYFLWKIRKKSNK